MADEALADIAFAVPEEETVKLNEKQDKGGHLRPDPQAERRIPVAWTVRIAYCRIEVCPADYLAYLPDR
jgi:hypothetical protein